MWVVVSILYVVYVVYVAVYVVYVVYFRVANKSGKYKQILIVSQTHAVIPNTNKGEQLIPCGRRANSK